jgi:hypothetical protein
MRSQVAEARIARFRELDRLIANQDALAGRVLDNAEARAKELRRKRPHRTVVSHYAHRVFVNLPARHPLDRKFQCGFDPLDVSIKQYRMHICNCKDRDCIGRHLRWLDLMEYFRKW